MTVTKNILLAPRRSVEENTASTYAADERFNAREVSRAVRGETTLGAGRAAR